MTVKEVLATLDIKEQKKALSLLEFFLNKEKSTILAHPELRLSTKQYKQLHKSLIKLKTGYPLAYIIKEQYFYGRKFIVNKNTLIPRPESEEIINIILTKAIKNQNKNLFIDIGTGSGALIISMAQELALKHKNSYQNSNFLASDIYKPTIKTAKLNSKLYNLQNKIKFKTGHLAIPFLKDIHKHSDSIIIIMANLPYLTALERKSEISIRFEPDRALIGGKDGLSYYRQMLKQLKQINHSHKFFIIMEINPTQANKLIEICQKEFTEIKIKKESDLSGQTRFITISNI